MRERRCPHTRIQDCPLYIASHYGDGTGCLDDMADPCLVARGRSYDALLRPVRMKHPELVIALTLRSMQEERASQRRRNLRLNGVHG